MRIIVICARIYDVFSHCTYSKIPILAQTQDINVENGFNEGLGLLASKRQKGMGTQIV